MFTIGIFSTHLPYIAFVFFYAFFFFFNIHDNPEDTVVKKGSEFHLSVVNAAETDYYGLGDEQAGQPYPAAIRQYDFLNFLNYERSGFYPVPGDPLIRGKFFSANFSRPPPSA